MIALVTGGASSGKSAFAERLALSLPGPHWYVATMRHGGPETEARIAKHVRARFGKGFETVELAVRPDEGFGPQGTVLLEDLSNMILNNLVSALDCVLACENAVLVSNEIGCDGVCYDGYTRAFIEELGSLSCDIAARADAVVEVVAGIPQVVKGSLALGRFAESEKRCRRVSDMRHSSAFR